MVAFTEDQVALIRSQIAPKATPDELQLFLYVCGQTGLNPLVKQIYCIHRNTKNPDTGRWEPKMTIQTSIDGFRVIAQRSGEYGGQSEPEFSYDDKGNLVKAKVIVYKFRGDVRYEAAVGIAYWNEYVQMDKDGKPTGRWASMPHVMLAKVAEAIALRKAFPQDLSGIYTDDEMAQADNEGNAMDEELMKATKESLKAQFIERLGVYAELVGENAAAPYHPDNWDNGRKTPKAYAAAIEAINSRIEEAQQKQLELSNTDKP